MASLEKEKMDMKRYAIIEPIAPPTTVAGIGEVTDHIGFPSSVA
jgi:hypothetical protein